MTENPVPEQRLRPPERDTSVPATAEQRRRKRRTIWLIVRIVLVILLVLLAIWGISSCVNALVSAANSSAALGPVAVDVGPRT